MRWVLVVALFAIATSGCLDAFRVSVSESALAASPLEWQVTEFPQEGGSFGVRTKETRYVHRTDDDRAPPFPGVLQVFSLRGEDSTERAALRDFADEVVATAIQKEGISIDPAVDASGERRLRSGVTTTWSLREGTIESGGGAFFEPQTQIRVRILSEVGADGRSNTGFIAVAFVKIDEVRDSPLPDFDPPSEAERLATWFDVVADPQGSIGGASFSSSDRGLLYNLRTHG